MVHYKQVDTMLTTGDVAHLLKVHPNTVRWWSDRGLIKSYRVGPRGERRFRRNDIAAFFFERTVQKYLRD